jgi:hypothetical protein
VNRTISQLKTEFRKSNGETITERENREWQEPVLEAFKDARSTAIRGAKVAGKVALVGTVGAAVVAANPAFAFALACAGA